MKHCKAPKNQTTRRILLTACATALVMTFTVALPQPAHTDDVTPPPVPSNIQVPAGNTAFLAGHAVGTQDYICLPCPNVTIPLAMCPASGFAWTFFGPQATLFDDGDGNEQVITHFLSPNLSPTNPVEIVGTPRATWQHSGDTSTVWAMAIASSSDPAFVASGAIPWLRLEVVGAQGGPNGGNELSATTFIQRLNTSGGVAPSTGCTESTHVGKKMLVPYTADYFFYRDAGNGS